MKPVRADSKFQIIDRGRCPAVNMKQDDNNDDDYDDELNVKNEKHIGFNAPLICRRQAWENVTWNYWFNGEGLRDTLKKYAKLIYFWDIQRKPTVYYISDVLWCFCVPQASGDVPTSAWRHRKSHLAKKALRGLVSGVAVKTRSTINTNYS